MHSPVKLWRNQKQIRQVLGKTGTVRSWTVIRVPPVGFASQAPYAVALVELANTRMVAQLVDISFESIRIGLKVRAVVRKVREPSSEGVIPYGIKFTPV